MEDMEQRRGFLGRDAENGRVWVSLRLHKIVPYRQGLRLTSTAHEPLSEYLLFEMGSSNGKSGMRIHSQRTARQLHLITRPATGWSTEEIQRLIVLGEVYRDNGSRYGCDHQDDMGRLPYPCPESGHCYGDRRLVKVITPEDEAEIRTLAAKLNGAWR